MPTYLTHDWFLQSLPSNVILGEQSWLYSAYAFLHYRSQRACGLRVGHHTGIYADAFAAVPPTNSKHCASDSIMIGNDVWIGTRAVILGGARLGDGAVVDFEVPAYASPPEILQL